MQAPAPHRCSELSCGLWSDELTRTQGATGLDRSLMGIRLQIISLKIWSSSRGFSMFSPWNGLAFNLCWQAVESVLFCCCWKYRLTGPSLGAQMVENLPAMQETWVRSLGREDPLEEGTETHSSILAWRLTWTEEPGGLQSTGLLRVRRDWVNNTHTPTHRL